MTPIFEAQGACRSFGRLRALDDVTLSVSAGERVALLGHNGAGKTTLFRLTLGFLPLDAGALRIDGHAPGSRGARRAVSYLPENVAFPKALTGREIVAFYARLKGVDPAEAAGTLDKVGLSDAADRRAGTYSKGMRQRLGLAQALIGRPRLLLLDEPTSGLDPVSRHHFYELIDEVAARGAAVLLSSHGLSEVEAKTDRVAILRNGRLVADAPLAELQRRAALPIRIRVRARHDAADSVQRRLGGTRVNGRSVELTCAMGDKMARLAAIHELGGDVDDIEVSPPSLDEIYRHYSSIAQEDPS